MNADDEVCLCFHVNFRKLLNFVRQRQPKRASELSNCFNAGTGCGWCRQVLQRIADVPLHDIPEVENIEAWVKSNFPDSIEDYAIHRKAYRESKRDLNQQTNEPK